METYVNQTAVINTSRTPYSSRVSDIGEYVLGF